MNAQNFCPNPIDFIYHSNFSSHLQNLPKTFSIRANPNKPGGNSYSGLITNVANSTLNMFLNIISS